MLQKCSGGAQNSFNSSAYSRPAGECHTEQGRVFYHSKKRERDAIMRHINSAKQELELIGIMPKVEVTPSKFAAKYKEDRYSGKIEFSFVTPNPVSVAI